MITIKDDAYFYVTSISESRLIDVNAFDSITVPIDIVKGKPECNIRYEIKDNLFVRNPDGRWRCCSIYYQENNERKKWQFWKPKEIYSQVKMERVE